MISNSDLLRLLSCVDHTTLSGLDSEQSVMAFCHRAATNAKVEGRAVAAVCVYPRFVAIAKNVLEGSGVKVATVAGAFPHGQLPLELKVREVEWCVKAGADEIDVVINRGLIADGHCEDAIREVSAMKRACGNRLLKVIVECGELSSSTLISSASMAALHGGADFIKTSTGKLTVGATHEAANIMLNCIKDYVKNYKRTVGFKAAGGIKSVNDAKKYAEQAVAIMGDDFFSNQTFRIGTSSLTDSLLSLLTN